MVSVVFGGAADGFAVAVVGAALRVGEADGGMTAGLADVRLEDVGLEDGREVVGADEDCVANGTRASWAVVSWVADGARVTWAVVDEVTEAGFVVDALSPDPPPPELPIPTMSTTTPATVATTGWLFANRTGRTAMPTV